MQIVYISNRPFDLERTLPYVKVHMSFVTETVVFCPTQQIAEFQCLGRLTVIDEKELINECFDEFRRTKDHQKKNYLLRMGLCKHPHIEAEFLMSDDDSRPIVPIKMDFYKADSKYHSFYFYSLEKWKNMAVKLPVQTSFDIGHFEELRLLQANSMSTWMFSSHMPQIFNKRILRECADFFNLQLKEYSAISEWGTYFNYALTKHPDHFHPPSVFRTLAWPHNPDAWPWQFPPADFAFENFHEELYEPDRLFHGLSKSFDLNLHFSETLIKVRRFTEAYMHARRSRAAKKACENGGTDQSSAVRSQKKVRPPFWRRLIGGR